MREINVLSWGGGTQSTALMLLMLDGKIKDENGNVVKPDYIMFADTKNEASFLYNQLYKVIDYVKKTYDYDIIVTSKNKEQRPDDEIIKLIENGLKYATSPYADLYQEHILNFKGVTGKIGISENTKTFNAMPFWVVDKNGKIGMTPTKACSFVYKTNQIMKKLRELENTKTFNKKEYLIKMYIGFSFDEISRVKPNHLSYGKNMFPLVDIGWTREMCVDFVYERLGFKPQSSVCNMCYANTYERVYKIYTEDKGGWEKLLILDDAMANKPNNHPLNRTGKYEVYMFNWQAKMGKRLKDIDMEEEYKRRHQYNQLSIFDVMEDQEQMACMGGCFL